MTELTVIGGGLGGLVTAITAARTGTQVTLYEAHRTLGGRARGTREPVTTGGHFQANQGPHVLYSDGPAWRWLAEQGLAGPSTRFDLAALRGARVRRDGRLGRAVPAGVLRMITHRRLAAPVDEDFATWAGRRWGEQTARLAGSLLGVVTYDADPGRLSAAFVWERLLRAFSPRWPAVRYVTGGWAALVDRLAARARALGVRIETDARVDALPGGGPVVVAVPLAAARTLLGETSLDWPSGHAALLDLGLVADRRDAFVAFDCDEGAFVERYSGADPTLAPSGHSLVQAAVPVRDGESRDGALGRLAGLVDLAMPGWDERVVWRQVSSAAGRTGALDLPGTSWADRPAIDRGEGVYLVGDCVAAPGLLGEVTFASAVRAARLAVTAATASTLRPV